MFQIFPNILWSLYSRKFIRSGHFYHLPEESDFGWKSGDPCFGVSERKCVRSQLNKDLNGKKVGSDLPFDCDLITEYTVHHIIYIIYSIFLLSINNGNFPACFLMKYDVTETFSGGGSPLRSSDHLITLWYCSHRWRICGDL